MLGLPPRYHCFDLSPLQGFELFRRVPLAVACFCIHCRRLVVALATVPRLSLLLISLTACVGIRRKGDGCRVESEWNIQVPFII
ncbi:MAG: hypothetical protein JWM04_2603 [Verrucomicrobiales bacterium]|nr:hypothetical protein [Verrucomicrobiales bacterium]